MNSLVDLICQYADGSILSIDRKEDIVFFKWQFPDGVSLRAAATVLELSQAKYDLAKALVEKLLLDRASWINLK